MERPLHQKHSNHYNDRSTEERRSWKKKGSLRTHKVAEQSRGHRRAQDPRDARQTRKRALNATLLVIAHLLGNNALNGWRGQAAERSPNDDRINHPPLGGKAIGDITEHTHRKS